MVDFDDEAKKLEEEGEQKAEGEIKQRFDGNKSNQPQTQPNQQTNQQQPQQ